MTRVLLVDDDEAVLRLQEAILKDAGFAVKYLTDGSKAKRLAVQGGYDVVVTDIYMPDTDGLEIIMELRRNAPNVGLVAVSGGDRYGSSSALSTAEVMGAVVLGKPFTPNQFVTAVNEAISAKATKAVQ